MVGDVSQVVQISSVCSRAMRQRAEHHICAIAHRLTLAKHWLCFSSLVCGNGVPRRFHWPAWFPKAVMPGTLAMVVLRPLSGALGLTALPVSASDPAPKPRTRGQ